MHYLYRFKGEIFLYLAENIKLTGLVDTMEDEAKEADEKQDDCEAEHAECSRDLDKAENSL